MESHATKSNFIKLCTIVVQYHSWALMPMGGRSTACVWLMLLKSCSFTGLPIVHLLTEGVDLLLVKADLIYCHSAVFHSF
jgi:hypothetical protein